MFARQTSRPEPFRASTGDRTVYAIGDIHGRVDLLRALLSQIEADRAASRPAVKPVLVFIGDYVDRGPSSKAAIDRVVMLQRTGRFEVRALMGNHERTLIDFLQDATIGPIWAMHGGVETLVDYGVSPPSINAGVNAWDDARQAFKARMPPMHLEFLSALTTQTVCGDYLFVHAGVRPGVPLSQQLEKDLLTIRHDFLAKDLPLEKVVVHGHTPSDAPFSGRYRINVDTGAYATGVLTAVRLEGADRRFLQAHADKAVSKRKLTLSEFRARWSAG